MPEPPLHQPHDKLLKGTFSNPENARAFFQNHLPASVAAACSWDSLQLLPSTFVNPQFAKLETDLLFHVRVNDTEAFVYLLFEHQSREHPWMALRLLAYVVRIWEDYLESHPDAETLPAVMPVVLAQDGKPWKGSTRLSDLIGIPPEHEPALRPWQPELVFKLIELVRIPYQDFRGTPEGVLTLRALKAAPVDELLSDPVWDPKNLESVSGDALERFLRYVYDRDLRRDAFLNRMTGFAEFTTLKTQLMTLAEQFREEGHQIGHQAGKAEGLLGAMRRAVLRALEIRHGAVPPELAARVQALDSQDALDRLHEAAICSCSVEDFARQLPS